MNVGVVDHPRQQVSRSARRRCDDGGVARLDGTVPADDRRHPSIESLEPLEVFEIDTNGGAEIDARALQLQGRSLGEDAAQHVARADRMQFGCTGRDHDVVGMEVEHVVRSSDHDESARIHTDDVVASCTVEDRDVPAFGACRRGGGRPGLARTNHHQIDVATAHLDVWLRRGRHRVGGRVELQAGSADLGVTSHAKTWAGWREAGPGEGNPIDIGHTVAAVTGQAQCATVLRVLSGADHRDGDRIAVDEVDGTVIEGEAHHCEQ
jgi:hypothetical protein